jgi:hypothetical protein
MTANVDPQRAKRRLRLRIARLRRRIDGRVHRLDRQRRRLTSWKTYVRRYPAASLLIAVGLGLTASVGLGRGRWMRMLGLQLVRRAGRSMLDALAAEWSAVWTDAAPNHQPADADCASDGES